LALESLPKFNYHTVLEYSTRAIGVCSAVSEGGEMRSSQIPGHGDHLLGWAGCNSMIIRVLTLHCTVRAKYFPALCFHTASLFLSCPDLVLPSVDYSSTSTVALLASWPDAMWWWWWWWVGTNLSCERCMAGSGNVSRIYSW